MPSRRNPTISAKVKPSAKGSAKSADRSREPEKKSPRFQVPFTRKNYLAFGVGLGVIILGYVLLGQPPAEGFLSLTLAPVLLVFGYCVVIPYAILARDKKTEPKVAPKSE